MGEEPLKEKEKASNFAVVDIKETILIWDINRPYPVLIEEIRLRWQDRLLETSPRLFLVSYAGELLVVWRRSSTDLENLYLFKVFKLEIQENFIIEGGNNIRYTIWIQIYQLENYCLFLGVNQFLALSCHEFSILKNNSIYFTYDPEDVIKEVRPEAPSDIMGEFR